MLLAFSLNILFINVGLYPFCNECLNYEVAYLIKNIGITIKNYLKCQDNLIHLARSNAIIYDMGEN